MNEDRPNLIFSVDVEDWGQSVLDNSLPIGEHCADNVRRLLELLEETPGATGTFFVLGIFAERHPTVVREIRDAGHEIASHGYRHTRVFEMNVRDMREDLQRSTDAIGNAAGATVRGFRSPVFSIGARNLWALDVLAEEGFTYDSSIFPIAGARYGIPDWPREAHRVRLENGLSIVEFPLTVKSIPGRNLPISGGGYARLLPGSALSNMFHDAAARRRTWPVFYCHPYEIDPDEFRRTSPAPPWGDRQVPMKLRLHQGLGRRGFADKIRRLAREFRFRSFRDALNEQPDLDEVSAADHMRDPMVPVWLS